MIAGFVTGSRIEDLLLQDGPDGCNMLQPKCDSDGPLVRPLRPLPGALDLANLGRCVLEPFPLRQCNHLSVLTQFI